jgi:hypothetical protein
MTKLLCFECGSEDFETREVIVRQEFRVESLDVIAPVSICVHCRRQTLGPGQADELIKRTRAMSHNPKLRST